MSTTSSPWNPKQYERFKEERSQPFYDLLAMCEPIPGGRAIDLGCGTGELTKVMHQHIGARSTVGLDNSETMLADSATFAGRGLTFKLGTILRFAPRTPFNLVFSNAAIQWVPDHAGLFPRLVAGLAEGGQLAIQMPSNDDHISHVTARDVADEEPFRTELGGYQRSWPVLPPDRYAEMLWDLGLREQSVRLQIYGNVLPGPADVVEWVKGTYLTDYQRRMTPELYERYLARYRVLLLERLPRVEPYFYAYKRVLIWGRRA